MPVTADTDIDFVGGRAALLADTGLQGRRFSDAYRTLTASGRSLFSPVARERYR